MYCTSCGAQVAEQQVYCPKCGKALPAGRVLVAGGHPLAWHLNLLSIFWYIIAGLSCIPTIILFLIAGGAWYALDSGGAGPGAALGSLFFYCIAGICAVITLTAFFTGWGLAKVRPWGRSLALVMGVISLFNAPFGTALGIYTLIVLAPGEAATEYDRLAMQTQVVLA